MEKGKEVKARAVMNIYFSREPKEMNEKTKTRMEGNRWRGGQGKGQGGKENIKGITTTTLKYWKKNKLKQKPTQRHGGTHEGTPNKKVPLAPLGMAQRGPRGG